jgi:hypothetical protein
MAGNNAAQLTPPTNAGTAVISVPVKTMRLNGYLVNKKGGDRFFPVLAS